MTGQVRITLRGSPAAGWLLALLIAAPAGAAAVAGARVTRPIEVSRPGLVKLSLDFNDVREMGPGGQDLRLVSPTGEELPFHHKFELTEERRTPVRLEAVERRPEGWRIRLDTGSDPAAHRAVLFEMAEAALAPGVRLEGSADGESWRLLAESDLFRVGGGSEMRGATLGYEPTTDRFLRLDWPLEAGFPEADKIALERGPASPIQQRLTEPECRSPDTRTTICRLRSEAPLAHRLALEIRGQGPVAFRLARAMNGTWLPVSEGVWRLDAGGARHRLPRIPSLERPSELRLELHGDDGAPELAAYRFDYPPQTVVFRAESAGRHLLAYGGDGRPAAGTLEATAAELRLAARVVTGAIERHPAPPFPPSAVAPRRPLPEVPFSRRWRVLAPEAAPGAVVRLTLPAEALAVSRSGTADLRLAVDDRQLPYLLWRPEVPVAIDTVAEPRPRPADERRTSLLEAELADADLPLAQIELTTRQGPFRRLVTVRPDPDPRRKLGAPEPAALRREWRCESQRPLPCRLSLELGGRTGTGRLRVELDDGDNPPLGELQIAVWRRATGLVFVWPERGDVQLLAGNPDLPPPAYDLALMRDRLLHRGWVEARLDLQAAAESRAATERRGRLLLTAVLAAAALFLLLLLARVLRPAAR